MELHRIDHVSLNVRDRAASLAWFGEVFALPVPAASATRPDQPVFLGPDRAQLGLFADRAPGLRHIAIATAAADQEQLVGRLERLGVAYRPESHRASESVYFTDPDGVTFEVMVPR